MNYDCLTSCDGVSDGDYASCIDCDVFLTCLDGVKYDNMPCPGDLHWNHKKLKCDKRNKANCKC